LRPSSPDCAPHDSLANLPASSFAMVAAASLEKPKRAQTSYMIFCGDIRGEITTAYQAKHGKANLGEIAKLMSVRWAALVEAEKSTYEQRAAKCKSEHEELMKAYTEATDPAGCLKKKFEHLIPKKPMAAYFLFSRDEAQREKAAAAVKASAGDGADASVTKMASKLGEMWKAMSASEKAVFETQQKKAAAEFEGKWKAWLQTPEFKELEKVKKEQGDAEKDNKRSAEPPTTKAKKSKTEKAPAAPEPELDAAVLKEAASLGLESSLKNLAGRPKIMASGTSVQDLLKELKKSEGLVNKAQQAILGNA